MRIMSAQNMQLPKIKGKIEDNLITNDDWPEKADLKTYVPDHLVNIRQSKNRLFKKLNKESGGISIQNQKQFLKE